MRQEIKNEKKIEYKDKDWAKAYKQIDMFAVLLNQEGGYNIKSFNKVSDKTLMPT